MKMVADNVRDSGIAGPDYVAKRRPVSTTSEAAHPKRSRKGKPRSDTKAERLPRGPSDRQAAGTRQNEQVQRPADAEKAPAEESKVPAEESKAPTEESKAPTEESKAPAEDRQQLPASVTIDPIAPPMEAQAVTGNESTLDTTATDQVPVVDPATEAEEPSQTKKDEEGKDTTKNDATQHKNGKKKKRRRRRRGEKRKPKSDGNAGKSDPS